MFTRKRFWFALITSNLYVAAWVGIGVATQKSEAWWAVGAVPVAIMALWFAFYDHYMSSISAKKLEKHLATLESSVQSFDAVRKRLSDIADRFEQQWLERGNQDV